MDDMDKLSSDNDKTYNPSGQSSSITNHALKYLSRLTDGLKTKKFFIYPKVEYGSEKHAMIAEAYIKKLLPLIDKYKHVDPKQPSQPFVGGGVVQKIRTRMDKTYHTREPFSPIEQDDHLLTIIDELCTMVEKNPNIQQYKDQAVVKRNSIMGYPAYTRDMKEKLAWLQYAAAFVRDGYKDAHVKFQPVFTSYYRRQWKSTSNKMVQIDGELHKVDRSLSDGWIMARNRMVFGGDPPNVVTSLAAQSCQHAVYETFADWIDIRIDDSWFKIEDGEVCCSDLPQMERFFFKAALRRIAIMVEKLTGLKGWADYLTSSVCVYKDEDGKLKISVNIANPSGQATVTITNFIMGLAMNILILRGVWPDFGYNNYKDYIKSLKNKGDDTRIVFYNSYDQQQYRKVLNGDVKLGVKVTFEEEFPPAMLGFIAYVPERGKFYMDYNYTNIAAGLCQKEKQNTEYFYISWLAKKQILMRNQTGKEIYDAFNSAFSEVMGTTYDVYVNQMMTKEERSIISGVDENNLDMTNLLVMTKPEMALYKYKLADINKDVLDLYYISFTGDEVKALVNGKGVDDLDLDYRTVRELRQMPSLQDMVDICNSNHDKRNPSSEPAEETVDADEDYETGR